MPPVPVESLHRSAAASRPAKSGAAGLAALTLALALALPAAAADRTRFQVELFGLTTLLSGSSSMSEGFERTDIFSPGIGFSAGATMGLTPHIQLGVRTGLFRDQKDLPPDLALARWSELPGYSITRAASAATIHRKLTTIPTHAILQYRGTLAGRFGFYDEIGAGIASFTEKIGYDGASGPLLRLAGYQKNLSLLFGGGVSWDYETVATVVAGATVEMIPSRDGQIWGGGDNPQFVAIQLGIRYPRR